MAEAPKQIKLFTDGACRGNPGPGGWAYILRHESSGRTREDAGGSARTTNNRMELRALIHGLEVIKKPSRVEIVSDSEYLLNGLEKWIDGWKAKGWYRDRRKQQPVKNADLWKRLDALRQEHELVFTWVRGHSGHAENERCDELATAEADEARKNKRPADLDPAG